MDSKEILQEKTSYLKRLRDLFKKKPTDSHGIPRAFRHIDPSDSKWTMYPQQMLPLFQKMILCVQDPRTRLTILDVLHQITKAAPTSDVNYDREQLQYQIFYAITGQHYGHPLDMESVVKNNIQQNDFFKLIFCGIRSYESVSSDTQKQFNKAVMPDVKKQNIAIPYRLQQYEK